MRNPMQTLRAAFLDILIPETSRRVAWPSLRSWKREKRRWRKRRTFEAHKGGLAGNEIKYKPGSNKRQVPLGRDVPKYLFQVLQVCQPTGFGEVHCGGRAQEKRRSGLS